MIASLAGRDRACAGRCVASSRTGIAGRIAVRACLSAMFVRIAARRGLIEADIVIALGKLAGSALAGVILAAALAGLPICTACRHARAAVDTSRSVQAKTALAQRGLACAVGACALAPAGQCLAVKRRFAAGVNAVCDTASFAEMITALAVIGDAFALYRAMAVRGVAECRAVDDGA